MAQLRTLKCPMVLSLDLENSTLECSYMTRIAHLEHVMSSNTARADVRIAFRCAADLCIEVRHSCW